MSSESSSQQGLNIKAISSLSGVSEHTLRAWERRYSAFHPQRSVSGRRLYTMVDVERARMLHALVDAGQAISLIAHLSDEELANIVKQLSVIQPSLKDAADFARLPPLSVEGCVAEILHSVDQFNLNEINLQLFRARNHFCCRTFTLQVVAPLLREIGYRVSAEKMNIAQEHAFSALLRGHLSEMLQKHQAEHVLGVKPSSEGRARFSVAISTPEGDHHDFGIYLAAILSSEAGAQVYQLGCNLPANEFARAANAVKADIAILGAVLCPEKELAEPLIDSIRKLDLSLNPKIELWLGGAVKADLSSVGFKRPVRLIPDLNTFDQAIAALRRGK